MRLLICHMRYQPDKTGTAPLVTQLAQDLASKGVDVTVITSLPHYGRSSVHPDYRDHRGLLSQSVENGVKVIRTLVYVPKSRKLLPRVLNYLSYNLASIWAGFLVERPDLVFAVNPPITTTFSAWLISIIRRSPLVVGIQDVWPDCLVRVGQLKNQLVIGAMRILERIQYRIAQKVIVLSASMKGNLETKGVKPAKIEVIENWADTAAVQPGEKLNDFYYQQELEGRFTILFSGNHGYISALECVLDAAALLSDRPEILFILAGEGSVKEDLVNQAARLNLKNVRFLPAQPEQAWLEMLSACDLALVLLRRELAGLNVPSKTYTLMAAGRPILASVPRESEIADLITNAASGLVCNPEDPAALADSILRLQDQPDLLQQMGRNGREYLLAHYNRQKQTEQYFRVFDEIVHQE